MKCKIPEISWHNRDPVLSVDIQPKSGSLNANTHHRLASGGTDSHVLIWYINIAADGSDINLDLAADLTRHQRAVNAVKWSPNGELLASGDDESVVFIWKQKAETDPLNILDSTNDQDKEVWITLKVLRGHMEDVYDLSWAPNSQFLVSGSVDNSAMIWDVHKGKSLAILKDHKGFVQGVAWDPKNQYIATLSTDRYLRIFDIQTKRVVHRVDKGVLPVPEGHDLHGRRMRLFHDDTLQTFFRRLCFTPDGKLLLTPAGVTDYEGVTHPLHTTYAFSRHGLRQPALVLPCHDQYTVAVRCCPLLFRLRKHNPAKNPPVVPLPYRMIFAVATRSSVYFYDTQQPQPFALISNIHYTRLTDVTWSSNGRIVVVSSTDGFCSLITFESGELGEEYEEMEAVLGAEEPSIPRKMKKAKENDPTSQKPRKPSTDEVSEKLLNARQPLLEKVLEEKKPEEQSAPTPIEVRRKVATPIQVKRKPIAEKVTDDSKDVNNKDVTAAEQTNSSNNTETISTKSLPADIIIDKEILSTEEKFESPEKKSRPATPIMVRRHPRTPTSANVTPSSRAAVNSLSEAIKKSVSEASHSPQPARKAESPPPRQSKRATPIAVRRKPRALIAPAPVVDTPTLAEEAMDAWPLPPTDPMETAEPVPAPKAKDTLPKTNATEVPAPDVTSDRTEDIRLFYEGTVEESLPEAPQSEKVDESNKKSVSDVGKVPVEVDTPKQNKDTPTKKTEAKLEELPVTVNTPKQNKETPNKKTPRRVALKTISTPKSKKKLMD